MWGSILSTNQVSSTTSSHSPGGVTGPATVLKILPLPDADEDTQEGCSPFVYGYYGLEPCFLRGIVRISHKSMYPLTITTLTIRLKGTTAATFLSPVDGDMLTREKILVKESETLLSTPETLHPTSQLDIPFQIALPEPNPTVHTSDLLRYALRIANLLPPSTQLKGYTGWAGDGAPFTVRTSYVLTAELCHPPSLFSSNPKTLAHALVEPFIVHDPRSLPLILQPDSKRWRSAPGDAPLEYEIELSATTLGPGDSFTFRYRLAVARESAAKGIRVQKVALVLREHRVVGTQGWGHRSVRGSSEICRWEFEELNPADLSLDNTNSQRQPADGLEMSELRPRRKLADGMTSYHHLSPTADAYDAGIDLFNHSRPQDRYYTYTRHRDTSESDSDDASPTSPTAPSPTQFQRRHFADGWSGGPGGDGLYVENEATIHIPHRNSHPFPVPTFPPHPSTPAILTGVPTPISPHLMLSHPSTIFTPSSPRASDPSLLYPSLQSPGTPAAQVEIKHSLQVRVEMCRIHMPGVRRSKKKKADAKSNDDKKPAPPPASPSTAAATPAEASPTAALASPGRPSENNAVTSPASAFVSRDGSGSDNSSSDDDEGETHRRRSRKSKKKKDSALKAPDPLVVECWSVLTSVGRSGCEGLLDQRPELVPSLDYDKIFGQETIWVPPYTKNDPIMEDPEERQRKLEAEAAAKAERSAKRKGKRHTIARNRSPPPGYDIEETESRGRTESVAGTESPAASMSRTHSPLSSSPFASLQIRRPSHSSLVESVQATSATSTPQIVKKKGSKLTSRKYLGPLGDTDSEEEDEVAVVIRGLAHVETEPGNSSMIVGVGMSVHNGDDDGEIVTLTRAEKGKAPATQ